MRNTKFIFIEGIMGSGKSTTALFLTEHLQKNGIAAQFMSEGGPLRVALDLPHPNGVWLDVTIEEYIELSLLKWRAFAQEARQCEMVTACDGLLFHGNMTDLLYQSYYALCNNIFAQLELPKLAIRNEGDWTKYYEEILSFLQLPFTPSSISAAQSTKSRHFRSRSHRWRYPILRWSGKRRSSHPRV